MHSREHILHKVRAALGRHAGQRPEEPPPVRLDPPAMDREQRIRLLLENYPGESRRVASLEQAREHVGRVLGPSSSVAFQSPLLEAAGILSLPGVRTGFQGESEIRQACADAEVGLTGADYALAIPGALVLFSSSREDRLVSLLPSVHLAVVSSDQILSGLDELFTVVPQPAAASSSMVLIGGPSRTGDIEMILVKGVHGPRELHLVVVDAA